MKKRKIIIIIICLVLLGIAVPSLAMYYGLFNNRQVAECIKTAKVEEKNQLKSARADYDLAFNTARQTRHELLKAADGKASEIQKAQKVYLQTGKAAKEEYLQKKKKIKDDYKNNVQTCKLKNTA